MKRLGKILRSHCHRHRSSRYYILLEKHRTSPRIRSWGISPFRLGLVEQNHQRAPPSRNHARSILRSRQPLGKHLCKYPSIWNGQVIHKTSLPPLISKLTNKPSRPNQTPSPRTQRNRRSRQTSHQLTHRGQGREMEIDDDQDGACEHAYGE